MTQVTLNGHTYTFDDDFKNYGYLAKFPLLIVDLLADMASGTASAENILVNLNNDDSVGFLVIGPNNGAGLPDTVTQAKIDKLIARNIPSENILWADIGGSGSSPSHSPSSSPSHSPSHSPSASPSASESASPSPSPSPSSSPSSSVSHSPSASVSSSPSPSPSPSSSVSGSPSSSPSHSASTSPSASPSPSASVSSSPSASPSPSSSVSGSPSPSPSHSASASPSASPSPSSSPSSSPSASGGGGGVSYISATARQTGSDPVQLTLPAGVQANDILLMYAYQTGTTPSGWTDSGGTGANGRVFWRRATGSGDAPTVEGILDTYSAYGTFHAKIVAFRGCVTSGTPLDPASPIFNNSNLVTISGDSLTTIYDGSMIVFFVLASNTVSAVGGSIDTLLAGTTSNPYIHFGYDSTPNVAGVQVAPTMTQASALTARFVTLALRKA